MRDKYEQEDINDMREALDFIEANPSLPMPHLGALNAFADKDDLADYARAMAPCVKGISSGYFELKRSFGSVSYKINFTREEVCEATVVGTREIPEKTTPAYTEDVIEWVCPDSILAGN